jgi:hypothetical protein
MIQDTLIDLCRQLGKLKCNISLKYLIIIFTCIIYISLLSPNLFSQSTPTPSDLIIPEYLLQEISFNQYIFRSYRERPIGWGLFQIFKDNSLVYQSDVDIKFWVEEEDDSLLKMGTDITGDGQPNLLVFHWCGNAYGTGDRYVFSIGEEFKLIQILPYGDFEDVNNDGVLEFIAFDNTFSFWHASHAGSPYPKLIYEYKKDNYQLSPALMYKPLPSAQEEEKAIIQIKKYIIECEVRGWKNNIWYYEGTYLPSTVWSYMLDLLYSGHPLEARQFLDKVWPKNKPGKELFLFNFKEKLNESRYWKKIGDDIYKTPEEKEVWMIKDEGKPEGYGQIRITSTPEGASIIFDDEYKGKTPSTLSEIPAGEHKLKLDSSGYEDWEEDILISSNQVKEVDIELVAKTGDAIVKVWPIPKEAEVFLDGVYVGRGFLLLEKVSPGEHLLKVTKEGYKDWQNTLSFYPGETHIVLADLKTKVKEEVPLEEVSFKNPVFILIGLVIFSIVVLYYKGLKREKNKKGLN